MRKAVAYLVIISLIISIYATDVYAGVSVSGPQQIMIFLKPDITVEFRGEKKVFKDVKGIYACPIVYKGRTYLPLRGISELMNEPIEWNEESKTIFIGKTMSHPDKNTAEAYKGAVETVEESAAATGSFNKMDTAYLKQDVIVMYDFVVKTFTNEKGETVNPILYKGSNYLPIRAISTMMNEPVTWNEEIKTIFIGKSGSDSDGETDSNGKDSRIVTDMKEIFSRTEALYYEATSKTTKISNAKTLEEKQSIAKSITKDYKAACGIVDEITGWKNFNNTEEVSAYQEVKSFVKNTENYLLLLENIAYLAASDQDYTMLSNLFYEAAMDSQNKMNNARSLLNDLK